MFNPFIINSNIVTEEKEIETFSSFMDACCGNIGNSYITYSLCKELGIDLQKTRQIKNIYEFDFAHIEEIVGDVSECTHTILVLQDQIRINESYGYRLNYKGIIKLIDYIDRPLLIVGLGANSLLGYEKDFHKKLNPDLIDFLKELAKRCAEIGIRGEFTEEVLHNLGINNTCVIGCPSYFENGKNRVLNKIELEKVEDILFSGSFYPDSDIEKKYKCHEILQDKLGEKYIKLVAFDELTDEIAKDKRQKYLNKQYYVFSDVEGWKSFAQEHKLILGYRLHGAIIGINSGIPAICCNGDARAREMCTYLNIPYHPELVWQNFDEFKLFYESIDIMKINERYKYVYSRYCDFISRILNVGQEEIERNIQNAAIKQPKLKLYGQYDDLKKMIESDL